MSTDHETVTLRALVRRINRRLRRDNERLRTPRGARPRADVGVFYRIDVERNVLIATHVDPERLALQLGVMQLGETLAE